MRAYVRFGSRLCKNYFFVAAAKYRFERLGVAATMIRPGYLPDSHFARLISMSAFSHSLGHKRKSRVGLGMSGVGGEADVVRRWSELPFIAKCGERQDKLAKDRR